MPRAELPALLASLLNAQKPGGGGPLIMGVMNVTPDSFSGDGLTGKPDQIYEHAMRMIDAGSDLLDIGAESSRPGAKPVTEEEERSRLLPALERIADVPVPISIDTRRPSVFREAMDFGATLINDIDGLVHPDFLAILRDHPEILAVLMHKKGSPETMQENPVYADVVGEVRATLKGRIAALGQAGIARERLILDPGLGFGKTTRHNFSLLRHLDAFTDLGPLLIGPSRKRFLSGPDHDLLPEERDIPTAAVMAWATLNRGSLFRTHRPDLAFLVRRTLRAILDADDA